MVHAPARNMFYFLNHSLHQSDIFITSSYLSLTVFYFKYLGQFKTIGILIFTFYSPGNKKRKKSHDGDKPLEDNPEQSQEKT